MANKDLCLARIEKSWGECQKNREWVFCAEVLRSLVKYLSVQAKIPLEYNAAVKKRIAMLEKKLDSMTFSDSRKVIDAIKYCRSRLNTTNDGPVRGGKFKTAISATERTRVTGTLDTGFLQNLKRPVVAFTDLADDSDELGGNDLVLDQPRLE
jgi:hypothetical protein